MGQNKTKKIVITASVAITISLVTAGIILANLILSGDDEKRRRQVQMVTLIKPPPPPKIQEKPPEPEIKKEEIKTPEPEPEDMPDQSQDEPPPGNQLGLDAEGAAGTDAFGLAAKKGGQALIGGGGSQYAWYYNMIIDELQAVVNRLMRENGGIPHKNLNTHIRIVVDDAGNIVDYEITRSSGNDSLDLTVKEALVLTEIKEPPPIGMPRAMNFKISPKS